jgi:hypothetical protein
VIYNLDSNRSEVYRESNLIEARAAAILTPHLMRHAPAVFLESFPVSSHMLMIQGGQNNCVLDKLGMDKLVIDKLNTSFFVKRMSGRQTHIPVIPSEARNLGFCRPRKEPRSLATLGTTRTGCCQQFETWLAAVLESECLIDETYS